MPYVNDNDISYRIKATPFLDWGTIEPYTKLLAELDAPSDPSSKWELDAVFSSLNFYQYLSQLYNKKLDPKSTASSEPSYESPSPSSNWEVCSGELLDDIILGLQIGLSGAVWAPAYAGMG